MMMDEIKSPTDTHYAYLVACSRRQTPPPPGAPARRGEPLCLSLSDTCHLIIKGTNVIRESPANHTCAWFAHFSDIMKVAPGLRLLHETLLATSSAVVASSSASAHGVEGEDGSGCAEAHRASCSPPLVSGAAVACTTPRPHVTAAEAKALSDRHRKCVRMLRDIVDGPSSTPLFVAASDTCKAAWAKGQRDARVLAGDLLPLLARVARLTDAEPAAADLAVVLTDAGKWEALVAEAIASAPVALAVHLGSVQRAFRDKVGRGRACSDMSEDGPDARELSFSEAAGAAAAAVSSSQREDARPALVSPAACATGAASTSDVPMGDGSTKTQSGGFS